MANTITINDAPASVSLKKTATAVTVDYAKMPQASLEHIFAYGIRQILNDAMASAECADKAKAKAEGRAPVMTETEKANALGMAQKRLDNLMSGTLRASGIREGDPVRKRALELASARVSVHPKVLGWARDNGFKTSAPEFAKEVRRLALEQIARDGNPFMAQAAKDVEAAKNLADIEL